MRKVVAALVGLIVSSLTAGEVKLAWDPNSEPDLAGYALYFGLAGGVLTNRVDVGNSTNATIASLEAGRTYTFHVRAYNVDRIESDPSNEVTYTVQVATTNTAPIIEPIGDGAVDAGTVLSFHVSAYDLDLPEQTLSYAFAGGAAEGATIDPVSGLFSWQPSSAQAGSTNVFTVVVTDSGNPRLSATQSFTVVVGKVGGEQGSYWLKVEGFENGFVSVSPRGSGKAGQKYAAGSVVTLSATADEGAVFKGWMVNGQVSLANPLSVTMNQNTTVSPQFENLSQIRQLSVNDPAGGLSMKIGRANGQGVITIGGEVGAWALESSSDLANWVETAWGITSERLEVYGTGNAFYRVRPNPEIWNE